MSRTYLQDLIQQGGTRQSESHLAEWQILETKLCAKRVVQQKIILDQVSST